MKQKKGAIWVSAVLYLTLGIIAITLILGAALPLVEKMKDRNAVIQTKQVLFTLDETIKTVANEGPGSQRELSPFIINAGELTIDHANNLIVWSMLTDALVQEENIVIQEGVIETELKTTNVDQRYRMELRLDYSSSVNVNLTSSFNNPFVGDYTAIIKHSGKFDAGN